MPGVAHSCASPVAIRRVSDQYSNGGASMSPERKMNGRDVAVLDSSEFVTNPDHQVAVVQIPVNKGPISGIATSHDGSRLMVSNYGGDSVSIVDVEDCRVVGTITGVDEPFAIAMGGVGADRAYVSTVSAAYD